MTHINELKDTDDILDALQGCDINIDNHNILTNLTTSKIKKIKTNVLKRFELMDDKYESFQKKLHDYIYVDEIEQLIPGSYIRWISIYKTDNKDDNIILNGGAFIKTIDILQNGIYITCMKKFYKNKIFKMKADNFIIFKKLTDDEHVILYALNYINS